MFNQRALSLDRLYSVLVAPQGLLAVFWYNPGFTPRQALSLAVWGVVYNAGARACPPGAPPAAPAAGT